MPLAIASGVARSGRRHQREAAGVPLGSQFSCKPWGLWPLAPKAAGTPAAVAGVRAATPVCLRPSTPKTWQHAETLQWSGLRLLLWSFPGLYPSSALGLHLLILGLFRLALLTSALAALQKVLAASPDSCDHHLKGVEPPVSAAVAYCPVVSSAIVTVAALLPL